VAFALVTSGKDATGGSASNRTVTLGGGTAGSDLFVVHVGYYQGSGTAPTLADSPNGGGSNTWLPSGGYLEDGNTGNRHTRLWYCLAPTTTGGSHTFTITENGSSKYMSMEVLCFSAGGAPTFDNHAVATNPVNNTMTMTITPVANDCLVVVSTCSDGDGPGPTHTTITSVKDDGGGATYDNTGTSLPTQYFDHDAGAGYVLSGMSFRPLSGGASSSTGVKWTFASGGAWPSEAPSQMITFAPPAGAAAIPNKILDVMQAVNRGATY
jgi:hypothetical protein